MEDWCHGAQKHHDPDIERSALTRVSARITRHYRNLITIDDRRSSFERHEHDRNLSLEMRPAAYR